MAMFFLCIKENWTLWKQHNAFVGSLLHSRKNTEKREFDYHYFLSCDSYRLLNLHNDHFSNTEFEEDIETKSMVYTFCQGIVWDDSDELLP